MHNVMLNAMHSVMHERSRRFPAACISRNMCMVIHIAMHNVMHNMMHIYRWVPEGPGSMHNVFRRVPQGPGSMHKSQYAYSDAYCNVMHNVMHVAMHNVMHVRSRRVPAACITGTMHIVMHIAM